jgi:hypothetical protein
MNYFQDYIRLTIIICYRSSNYNKNDTSDCHLDERLPLPRTSLLHAHALPTTRTAGANNPQPTERHGTFIKLILS